MFHHGTGYASSFPNRLWQQCRITHYTQEHIVNVRMAMSALSREAGNIHGLGCEGDKANST